MNVKRSSSKTSLQVGDKGDASSDVKHEMEEEPQANEESSQEASMIWGRNRSGLREPDKRYPKASRLDKKYQLGEDASTPPRFWRTLWAKPEDPFHWKGQQVV